MSEIDNNVGVKLSPASAAWAAWSLLTATTVSANVQVSAYFFDVALWNISAMLVYDSSGSILCLWDAVLFCSVTALCDFVVLRHIAAFSNCIVFRNFATAFPLNTVGFLYTSSCTIFLWLKFDAFAVANAISCNSIFFIRVCSIVITISIYVQIFWTVNLLSCVKARY
jgi:hypothetical protein